MYENEPRVFSEEEAMQLFRDLEIFAYECGAKSYRGFCYVLKRDNPELYALFDSCRGWNMRRFMRLYVESV